MGALPVAGLPQISTAQSTSSGDLLWKFETEDSVQSSPTVVNETVFIGSDDGNLYAIDANSGDKQWDVPHADGRSAAAVVDNTVYIGNDRGVYALDEATGDIWWTFNTGAFGEVRSSPTVIDERVYFGSQERHGAVYGVTATTGEQLWRIEIGNSVADYASASATVVNDTVYIGDSKGRLLAIDGETGEKEHIFETDDSINSSATIVDGIAYFGSDDGNIYAVDIESGNEQWRFTTERSVRSSPTIANGILYVGSTDQKVYALELESGNKIWEFETNGRVFSSPSVVNNRVFVASEDNKVYALGTTTGSSAWEYETGEDIIYSSPIVVDGILYIGSLDGNVYAIDTGLENSSSGSRSSLGTLGHHHDWANKASAWQPSRDATITLDNAGSDAWKVTETDGVFVPLEKENPLLTLQEGVRYIFENNAWDDHPLAFRDRDNIQLLSQSDTGNLEDRPDIYWTDKDSVVAFTIRPDLTDDVSGLANYTSTNNTAKVGKIEFEDVNYTNPDGQILFKEPADGDSITGSINFQMDTEVFVVEAVENGLQDGHGHLHLLIDREFISPNEQIPMAEDIVHLDEGSSDATLELEPGTHTIRAQAGDAAHIAYDLTDEIEITVEEMLTAKFSWNPTKPSVGTEISFDASDATGNIESYNWAFGDGTTATGMTVTHAYETVGEYTVELTVDGAEGTDTTTEQIEVLADPEVEFSFNPQSPTVDQEVTFDASASSSPNGEIVEYRWDFTGDGQLDETITDSVFTHTYEEAGDYEVELTIIDTQDKSATESQMLSVDPEDDAPPALPGQEDPPQDLDDDGLYEDINGDGDFTIADVQVFFQQRDADVVQNNPEYFNFARDEPADVSIGDVQALFQLFQEQS